MKTVRKRSLVPFVFKNFFSVFFFYIVRRSIPYICLPFPAEGQSPPGRLVSNTLFDQSRFSPLFQTPTHLTLVSEGSEPTADHQLILEPNNTCKVVPQYPYHVSKWFTIRFWGPGNCNWAGRRGACGRWGRFSARFSGRERRGGGSTCGQG